MTIDLRLGDCLDVLPTLEAASVDALVTDPPYFLPAVHYQTRKQFTRSLSDLGMLEYFFRDFFKECQRILKPTGVYYIFCDGQSYPVFYALCYPYSRRIVPLVWDKQVAINGYSWRHQHELILFSEMPMSPSVKTGDGDVLKYRAVPINDRQHPAAKPVELLKRLIEKSVPVGGVVLDPFMGSGATGKAASETGRSFIGIEKEPRYFDIAQAQLTSDFRDTAILSTQRDAAILLTSTTRSRYGPTQV